MNRRARRQSSANPLLILAVLAAVPALVLWSIARWAGGKVEAGEDAAPLPSEVIAPTAEPQLALSTGLLSMRRTAGQLSIDLNQSSFAQSLAPLFAQIGERSCVAVSLNGRLVGEVGIDRAVIPASNQKILVAAAALDILGPEFTYQTRLVGPRPTNGVITGDVYLVGGGDPVLAGEWYEEAKLDTYPMFNTTPIDELARQLNKAGVTQIQGSVLGDGSRYDDEFYVPGWGEGVAGLEGGPYDALLVNDARVNGEDQRASDPNEAGARELVRLLGEQGITVSGGAGIGTAAGGGDELATISSMPLPAIIEEMLTTSDNNTAEMMVKEIGFQTAQLGTRQAGLDAIKQTIAGWGIDTTDMVLDDGSGLSPANMLTCQQMIAILDRVGFNSAVGQGMAIAGETGTLESVFPDTAMDGQLRGKTGTLNNPPFDQDPPAVKALSGYLPVEGDTISYALILNDAMIAEQDRYRPIWAEFATALASYPAVASASVIGPR